MSMTHDEMIAVIAHHKNGGKVEYKHVDNSDHDYVVDVSPSFDFATFDYRIKPEPRSLWEVRNSNEKHDSAWLDKSDAKNRANLFLGATIHEYKEVKP